jgi:Cdc6-like AAA superfamily ATPase
VSVSQVSLQRVQYSLVHYLRRSPQSNGINDFRNSTVMAEGLALAASIIAVIQISDSVISLCGQFIGKVKGAEKEVSQMITTVTALKGFLEFVETFVKMDENASRLPLLDAISHQDGPLTTCMTLLKDLEAKLRPPKRDYNGVLRAISWPLMWKDIGQALETIEKQKTLIMLAMQGDSTRATLAIENTVNNIHRRVETKNHKEILQWLMKTDPISNHTAACAKHEPGTGDWFISSHEFSYWLLPGRSLWLHGIPGAGKTVLCSTVIENVKSRCSSEVACLYYYFDFSNPMKQNVTNMLYSLLAQLSTISVPTEVRHLYEISGQGTREATVTQLIDAFLSIVKPTPQTFVILDALDESSDRKSMFEVIEKVLKIDKINLLMTSREESDIQNVLEHSVDYVVPIEDKRVDADIHLHVNHCLHNDPELNKWDADLKSKINSILTSKAHGM